MPPKNGRFSPTHLRIMRILEDGERHTRAEIRQCLLDDQALEGTISKHIQDMRKVLADHDIQARTIVCEFYKGRYYYRLIRLITGDDE